MSREIKFRAWDKDVKKFADMCAIHIDGDIMASSQTFGGLYDFVYDEMAERIVLQQYTGLKDKNGVEIYEGDIVQYETNYYGNRQVRKAEVKWHDDLEHDGFGEPLAMGYIFRGANIEVIGNIYEHGHLLENILHSLKPKR